MKKTLLFLSMLVVLASAAPAASAAGPRPLFQSPAPCGQVWTATTYSSHDFLHSIDMGQWSGSTNISDGEPVLASADGTVEAAGVSSGSTSGYGNYVDIDHGGGWLTRYAHLKDAPDVTVGQMVAQGEQIGRIGKTGGANGEDHLHYTQLADGAAQHVAFDGTLIATNGNDSSTWGKWGQAEAEKILSHNCAQNSFLTFNEGGSPHHVVYEPATGTAKIQRVNAGGQGSTGTFSGTWQRRWTHMVTFPQGTDTHAIVYKGSTGEVKFGRLSASSGFTTLSSGAWGAKWTSFTPLRLGGRAYYLAYSSVNGAAVLDKINASGTAYESRVFGTNWGKGWTHLVPFVRDGTQYVLSYMGGTGDVVIDKVTLQSNGAVAFTRTFTAKWSTGWSHLVPTTSDGVPLLIAYNATSGVAKFLRPKAGGAGVDQLAVESWTLGWTAFSPYVQDGLGHYLAYKGASGRAVFDRIPSGGAGSTRLWSTSWAMGWA